MTGVISDYHKLPSSERGASVALGNFDGVHAGHRAVIEAAAKVARDRSIPLAALIFEPPPRQFFRPDGEPFRIMRTVQRREALRDLGVEIIYELPFDAPMSKMTPEVFVKTVLVDGLGLQHLAVGFDFRFGQGREGDTSTLDQLAKAHGFTLSVVSPVTDGSAKISSTAIRNALQEGRPGEAATFLEHYWIADGVIEQGEQRGRTINFPTANLRLGELIQPRFGVYAVWARIEGLEGWHAGVANFGRTPTTGDRDPLLEVHLFDFERDIYGRKIEVALVSYLRKEKKFDSFEALTVQIATDASDARQLLKAQGGGALHIKSLPQPA